MKDIFLERDITHEQFIDMMAVQWKYAVKVIEQPNRAAHTTTVQFKAADGSFTALYRINSSYWDMLKPRIILKADSLT